MTASLTLPGRPGLLEIPDPGWATLYPPPSKRHAYAAAHVAARPDGSIDWDATLRFREHLWAHGFGLAEAMDTAQRGMGLTFDQARELIERSSARAAELGTQIVSGAGTDQLTASVHPMPAIIAGVRSPDGVRSGHGIAGHPHGEPRAGRQRADPRKTISRSTASC